ncbi:MAG: copper-binding protein [Betaproteobacteria bacterium]|nr:MAG: copper-binding protein [Betaproteobacteria bacterium]
MKRTLLVLGLALSSVSLAQMSGSGGMQGMHGQGGMQGMQGQGGMQMGQPGSALAEGEVRKVDKDAGKITLRHGPIASMDMPPMTMVYRVKDPAMLDQMQAGDKVQFMMEKVSGTLTVTKIEPLK